MRGYGWDDEVQDEMANKIEGWFEHLKGLACRGEDSPMSTKFGACQVEAHCVIC